MFPFLTLCPVIFYSNKNLENFINSNDSKIQSYDYKNLNYFKNRDKIGIVQMMLIQLLIRSIL